MGLRPELVEVVGRLRREHHGCINDDELPAVRAALRAEFAEAEVVTVLAEAFSRNPDGTSR